ncbi:ribonuclease H-like domain-containing protein [Tanacetum coccineum]
MVAPSTFNSVDSINNLNAGNPLHVQNSDNNDNSNFVIIPFKLFGNENYRIWSGAVKLALQARNKYGFVDDTCLKESYCLLNGIDAMLWPEPVRNSLLTRDPFHEVKDAYNVVSRKESHRGVLESSSGSASNVNKGPNPNLNCKHYGKIGHTINRCFEIVGFPEGLKRNPNTGKQTFNANFDVKMNDKSFSSSLSSGFTPEHMQKLLSMINDKPSGSIHANMAVLWTNASLACCATRPGNGTGGS